MNHNPTRVLVIEDDSLFFEAVKMALKTLPVEIFWAKNSPEALKLLKEKSPFAVAIVDQNLPNIKGDELALVIKKQYPDQQIIFATGDLTQETLTLLLQSGLGVGFIPKGQSNAELTDPILKAITTFEREIKILGGEPLDPLEAERKLLAHGIVGRSEALQKILERKEAYRRLPASTIIFGESGTGKEVIAHALAEGINEILPVNCSTFIGREHMMEAELFGVVKGAFTGADKDRAGLFEIAKGRIIFLDEIHHLSLSAQAKLLRVLQEKKVVRVGDNADNAKTCDFQIISAAKPELWDQLQSGSFLK